MKALVVGGSRGIGAATITRLESAGWETVEVSRASGTDVADRQQLSAALDALPQVDALVYSAGHVNPAPFLKVADGEWDYHVEVNLTAPVRCLRWFAEQAPDNAPAVLIASTAALRPSPRWAPYSATKAAMVNLALTAAVELAPVVRLYAIAPGRCATDLRAMLAPEEDPDTIMRPSEVAEVIATLLADESGVLAGQCIQVARRW